MRSQGSLPALRLFPCQQIRWDGGTKILPIMTWPRSTLPQTPLISKPLRPGLLHTSRLKKPPANWISTNYSTSSPQFAGMIILEHGIVALTTVTLVPTMLNDTKSDWCFTTVCLDRCHHASLLRHLSTIFRTICKMLFGFFVVYPLNRASFFVLHRVSGKAPIFTVSVFSLPLLGWGLVYVIGRGLPPPWMSLFPAGLSRAPWWLCTCEEIYVQTKFTKENYSQVYIYPVVNSNCVWE